MFWIDPTPSWNYQWLTFGLTDAILLLDWRERHRPPGWKVFHPCWRSSRLCGDSRLQVDEFGWLAGVPFSCWFASLSLT